MSKKDTKSNKILKVIYYACTLWTQNSEYLLPRTYVKVWRGVVWYCEKRLLKVNNKFYMGYNSDNSAYITWLWKLSDLLYS